jgi:hypothetical protein
VNTTSSVVVISECVGLARGVVGSARVVAFGASNVAPAGSVVAGLVIV